MIIKNNEKRIIKEIYTFQNVNIKEFEKRDDGIKKLRVELLQVPAIDNYEKYAAYQIDVTYYYDDDCKVVIVINEENYNEEAKLFAYRTCFDVLAFKQECSMEEAVKNYFNEDSKKYKLCNRYLGYDNDDDLPF